ncbi:hypothetical protein AAVH_03613 [Aphelenchoides avenae]|nr:hypothetical protein AAVH_03613 [Aphelenchus avenae]
MTRSVRSFPAGNGGVPPQANVQIGAQRISREEYLKTIKAEILSTLGSHARGATLTVVGGAFKEDFGEEPSEVARNLGYATFERLLQSEELSDIIGWEITAGTGTGCGTGFCYKAKPTERIEHIMRDMEVSEQSREEQDRAEEAKKRAMLEHPQNDERVLQGKERILMEEYLIKYAVVFGAEELKKYFGKSSPKKVFVNFMHQEVELFQDNNHGGQLYLKMKKPLQDFLAEYARIREEAKIPKDPAPFRRKPFTAEGGFNGRQGQNLGDNAVSNGVNGSGRNNGLEPNHFRKNGGSEGFQQQPPSFGTSNGSGPCNGFSSRNTNNQKQAPVLASANPPLSNTFNNLNGSAQSTGFGGRRINAQKPELELVPVQPRIANGNAHAARPDGPIGFNQTQDVADRIDVQDNVQMVQQPRNGGVRGFGIRKPAAAAFGARSPRPVASAMTMRWRSEASGPVATTRLPLMLPIRGCRGREKTVPTASGARGFRATVDWNVNVQQHAAPRTVPPVNLVPVLPGTNSSSSENSTNGAQRTVPPNLVPLPAPGLKNPYSSSDDEDDVAAPAVLPKPSAKGSTRKLPPNLVPITANGIQPGANQLSPASTVSYKSADGDVARRDLQNNREANKAAAKNTKYTGRGNGVYTDVEEDSDDEDSAKEPATVGVAPEPIVNNTSAGSIFNRKPQPGFIQEVPSANSHAAKWLEMSAASARNNRSKSAGAPLTRNHYTANGTSGTNEQVGHRFNGFPNSANAPPALVPACNGFAAPQDSSRFRKTQKTATLNDSDVTPAVPKEKEGTHAMLCFNVRYLLTLRGRITVSVLNSLISNVCGREVSPASESGLNMSLEAYIRKFCSFAELIDDSAQDVTVAMRMDARPPAPMELLRTVLGNIRDATAN